MRRYSYRLNQRRKKRSKKWLYLFLIAVVVVSARYLIKEFNPIRASGQPAKVEVPKADHPVDEAPIVVVEPVVEPDLAEIAKTILSGNPEIDEIVAESIAYIASNPPRIIKARDQLNKMTGGI